MASVKPSMSFSNGSFFEKSHIQENNQQINVAAIDIGTNSIHLLIASIDAVLQSFTIRLAEKSTTRLGELCPDTNNLTEVAIARSLEALKRYKELASSYQVDQILVAATSAVREANNGEFFLNRMKEELSMEVEIISGPEEARLIYLGVLSGMQFGDKPHLVLDIGGGSTELILADGRDAQALTSTKVGAVRLKRDFLNEDPIPKKRIDFLKVFIQGSLEPAVNKVLRRIKSGETPVMIATSGTAMAIAALASNKDDNHPIKLDGYKISKELLDEVVDHLLPLTPEERIQLPSLSERRSEIIVPGALILQTAMKMLKLDELILSERALREGLIVDWMLKKGFLEDRFSFQSSIRHRTVIHQAKRFGVNRKRADMVASHALTIYDKTYGVLHDDEGKNRELLWAASMLYSCGQHINISSYHKHSWYLIRNAELLGYSQIEHLIIAAIARYHRRSLPKKRHESWQALITKGCRKSVSQMSLILRLASSLNQRPDPVVEKIKIEINHSSKIQIKLIPARENQSLSLEEWSFKNSAKVIKDEIGVEIDLSS